ncbi:class I SAM-dependent methyltransferase [Mesorhizobium sp. M1339]|uniref:class I SAM-dependent methyltransferase n=1 Tax=Mesorhizobium sp. M1339 TaxID=2957086 RepID=UPI0033352814
MSFVGNYLPSRVLAKLDSYRNSGLDCRASVELAKLGLKFLPWTVSAMRPSAVFSLVNEIIINKRKTVLEFGSGISTLYLSKAAEMIGGTVISIEDNPVWASLVSDMLKAEGLSSVGQVLVATLQECSYSLDSSVWYDTDIVSRAVAGSKIDLVVVDGPRAHTRDLAHARYPALPVVYPHLSPRCAVVLDDISRSGERHIIKRWEADSELKFDQLAARGGYAIARRGDYFVSSI